jgi:hypothetical protein
VTIHIELDSPHWALIPDSYPFEDVQSPEAWADLVSDLAAEIWEYDDKLHAALREELLLHALRPRIAGEHRFVMTGLPDGSIATVDVHDFPHEEDVPDESLLGLPDERLTSPARIEPVEGRLGIGGRSVRYVADPEMGYDIVGAVNWVWRSPVQDVVVTFGTANLVLLTQILPDLDEFAASIGPA